MNSHDFPGAPDLASSKSEAPTSGYARARTRMAAEFPRAALAEDLVLLDGYGRILDSGAGVTNQFGFLPGKLLGKRLVHRLGAASRSPFLARLVAVRAGWPFPPLTCDAWTRTFQPLRMTLSHGETPLAWGRDLLLLKIGWEADEP